MTENTEFVSIVHLAVSTSKEMSVLLQEKIAESKTGELKLTNIQAQTIASQLRITANLVVGLLEENSQILDRVATLRERLEKK